MSPKADESDKKAADQRRRRALARRRAPHLLAAAAIFAVLGGLLLPLLSTQPSQLSAYSGHWGDLSELREMFQLRGDTVRPLLTGPGELRGAAMHGSLLVVMGIERGYTSDEVWLVRSFINGGGALLLADDFGNSESLLQSVGGSSLSISPVRLRDISYQKNPDYVRVRARTGNSFDLPTSELLLNRPAALQVPSSAFRARNYPHLEVFVNASRHAWLDDNGNLARDPDENEYNYAVVAGLMSDQGNPIVVASDPGLFINDMMAWNRPFVQALVDRLSLDVGQVFFDESRHEPDTAAGKVGTGLLRTAAAYAANPLALFVTFLLLLLAFGYQFAKLPARTIRRHRDALDQPRLMHFAAPWVSIHEFRRLRVAIVERVRLAYGVSPEEFYPAMLPRLPELLGDRELQHFLEYETYPDMGSFQRTLQRALAWRPPCAAPDLYPQAAPTEAYVVPEQDIEVVELADRTLDLGGLVGDGTRLWDPGAKDRRPGGSDADALLYGGRTGTDGNGAPGGGQWPNGGEG